MNEFKARSTLGSEAVPVFDDDGELTEWLRTEKSASRLSSAVAAG